MKRKVLSILLISTMILSLASCTKKGGSSGEKGNSSAEILSGEEATKAMYEELDLIAGTGLGADPSQKPSTEHLEKVDLKKSLENKGEENEATVSIEVVNTGVITPGFTDRIIFAVTNTGDVPIVYAKRTITDEIKHSLPKSAGIIIPGISFISNDDPYVLEQLNRMGDSEQGNLFDPENFSTLPPGETVSFEQFFSAGDLASLKDLYASDMNDFGYPKSELLHGIKGAFSFSYSPMTDEIQGILFSDAGESKEEMTLDYKEKSSIDFIIPISDSTWLANRESQKDREENPDKYEEENSDSSTPGWIEPGSRPDESSSPSGENSGSDGEESSGQDGETTDSYENKQPIISGTIG